MFGLQVITEPAEEPLTLEQAKENLRFDGPYESDRIRALITAARIYCERATGKAFITQTLRLTLDSFSDIVRLPRPPLQSVTSVKYDDLDNVEQTLATTVYSYDANMEPGRLYLADGEDWPDIYTKLGAVRITYVAGYGLATAVPETIKQAMHLLISHWFNNREVQNVGTIFSQPLQLAVESLLGCESAGALVGTYP